MTNSRRQFIQKSGSLLLSASALGTTPISANAAKQAKDQKPTLVTIYLRGGVDTLSVLVPCKEKSYAGLRPTLAVPAPDSNATKRSLSLDDRFALNPNLPELHALYEKGLVAPVVCVGSHHTTRSHFDAQDFMERAAPGMRHVKDGWLNRYLSETRSANDSPLRALALQARLPRSLRGDYPVIAVPTQQSASDTIDEFAQLYGAPPASASIAMAKPDGKALRNKVTRSGHDTITQLRYLNEIMAQSSGNETVPYPNSSFGRQMQQIARVIKADKGLEIAAVDYGGWDHHTDEGPLDGNMAGHLAKISAGIGAFTEDLGSHMNRVLILVMSEFGRSVQENGNTGTDHGHGGLMFAVGGMVNGHQVLGKWTGLDPSQLYEERDLPVHTDFRNVFAETLLKLHGYDGIQNGVFPEYTPANPPLDFINPV
jgi:uncharacterized protein (DUF1501 family)